MNQKKMILSKSNINSDVFDVVNFVSKDCTEITIPSNIKLIGADSFAYCNIDTIFIPKSVTRICEMAFNDCNASSIVFEKDSDLQIIDYGAFDTYSIKYFNLPGKIKYLDLNSFNDSEEWKFIEVFSEEIYIFNRDENSSFLISFPNVHKIQFNGTLSNSVFYTLPNAEFIYN